jgi:DNA-binding transcriptional ArsR family regulator
MLDRVFSALADPTRRSILTVLASRREMTVGEIAEPFGISLPAISKHLKVLEDAKLLRRARRGRTVLCRLEPKPMQAAMDWLVEQEKFWNARLDALASLLEETPWSKQKTSRSVSSAPSKPARK